MVLECYLNFHPVAFNIVPKRLSMRRFNSVGLNHLITFIGPGQVFMQ